MRKYLDSIFRGSDKYTKLQKEDRDVMLFSRIDSLPYTVLITALVVKVPVFLVIGIVMISINLIEIYRASKYID
jgi:hypothetical protein